MVDEFLERVVPALGRLLLQMGIGQSEEGGDEQAVRNAFRIFQNDVEGFDRLLGVPLRQIKPAKQEPALTSLGRELRFRFAQETYRPRSGRHARVSSWARPNLARVLHGGELSSDWRTRIASSFRPRARKASAWPKAASLRHGDLRVGRDLRVKRERRRPTIEPSQGLRPPESGFRVIR